MDSPTVEIPLARWSQLMCDDAMPLTPAEIEAGWHFCPDWDGLLIGPGMMELESCGCSKPATGNQGAK